MAKRIIYTPEGRATAAVVYPILSAKLEYETEDEFVERIMAKDVPAGTNATIVDESDIPSDNTFRDAWRCADGKVVHDMTHAREIHRDRIREARAPLLAALDIDYQRADERNDGAEKARIVARKNKLRDAPAHPGIDTAATIDELKAVWPLEEK